MKPLRWDKQLGLASPLECAAIQSNQTNNPSMDRDEVGLDSSPHTRISQMGGENLFFLTSSLIGMSAIEILQQLTFRGAANSLAFIDLSASQT